MCHSTKADCTLERKAGLKAVDTRSQAGRIQRRIHSLQMALQLACQLWRSMCRALLRSDANLGQEEKRSDNQCDKQKVNLRVVGKSIWEFSCGKVLRGESLPASGLLMWVVLALRWGSSRSESFSICLTPSKPSYGNPENEPAKRIAKAWKESFCLNIKNKKLGHCRRFLANITLVFREARSVNGLIFCLMSESALPFSLNSKFESALRTFPDPHIPIQALRWVIPRKQLAGSNSSSPFLRTPSSQSQCDRTLGIILRCFSVWSTSVFPSASWIVWII